MRCMLVQRYFTLLSDHLQDNYMLIGLLMRFNG